MEKNQEVTYKMCPNLDGTGPFGTFRNCMPLDSNGNPLPFYGRGLGRGFGRGRGFRFRYLAAGSPAWAAFGQPYDYRQPYGQVQQPSQQDLKREEIAALEQELEAIKKRLSELKKEQ
jgi:hypothetical protein